MATLEKFEDLLIWCKAREITNDIYQITASGGFQKDYRLSNQIQRAAVSIMSNIAEGFDRGGNKEFIQFLWIAKGSAFEVESQLYVALDNRYISPTQFSEIRTRIREIKSQLAGFIRYLKNSGIKGIKYKS